MRRTYFAFSIVQLFFSAIADAQPCDYECAKLLAPAIVKQFDSLRKDFEAFLDKSLAPFWNNSEEQEFLRKHPGSLVAVRSATCNSLALSYQLCGVSLSDPQLVDLTNDEETDAIRHFVWSVILACAQGPHFAKKYTTIHELGTEPVNASPVHPRNAMDLHNNAKGIEWVQTDIQRCHSPLFESQVLEAAVYLLATDKLQTLKKGETKCASLRSFKSEDYLSASQNKKQSMNAIRKVGLNCY